MQITWLEAPWPDANVDSLDTDDRGLRSATVRAVVRTVEGANAMECPRVVCAVSTAGDALRFALDSVLASAERQGLMLGLRGPVEPSALRGLLREYEGAPLGWILELTHSDDLADAADGRVLACVLPNDDDADLGRWRDRIDPATARVFDPDPGSEPDELHERAAAMLADLVTP
jgi:hypothetical protein